MSPNAPVLITGLYETHINVVDLEKSTAFYVETLGLELGRKEETRRAAFLFAGGWGKTMLGLWEKPKEEVHTQHFAFEIPPAHMERVIEDLHDRGIPTRDFHGVSTKVPSVFAWTPAVSIYFQDPDGHRLEYLARLPGEPDPDGGIVPWDEWRRR
ncbi:MAG: VOC family protein [Planctomycetota bacterium]